MLKTEDLKSRKYRISDVIEITDQCIGHRGCVIPTGIRGVIIGHTTEKTIYMVVFPTDELMDSDHYVDESNFTYAKKKDKI